MFRHLLKPIWRRKSRNLMLSLEIMLAFVVVFAIAAASVRCYQLYHMPTGFQYQSVWSVEMQLPDERGGKTDPALFERFKRGLEALPEVEQVSFASFSPYQMATWRTGVFLPDSDAMTDTDVMQVSDDFFDTVGMKLQEGRWFSRADDGAAQEPVVINRRLADAMFPGQSALGKSIADGKPGSKDRKLQRVVGVVEAFRNHGEFMSPTNFVLTRFSPQTPGTEPVRTILIRVRPGTDRMFETRLSSQLKLVRNDWSYHISPLADLRTSLLQETTTPLMVMAVIAAFLLLMVAFGLFGVLWQNTTRRIPEIGLRRAAGATGADIYRQIVLEQVLLTLLAMLAGLVLLVQLPITGVLGENLSWPLFLGATLASMAIMVLVSVLCALYPAWRASRLNPTEALHYE